jgi:putative peptidoglycan lipid II flippase
MAEAAGSSGRGLWRAAGLISALTMLSRVLGLVREVAFARLVGAGFYSDAYRIAFRVPNLLRDLFAEGALSAAFVPTYTRVLKEGGRPAAFRLAARVMSVLSVVLSVVVLIGVAAAGPLVNWLAHGFATEPGKTELTVLLTRVMMPFLPLVSFAAVAMGMLNAEERFGRPAIASAMFNLVSIAGAVLFWALGLDPRSVALGWSITTLLGGLAQFLIQLPELHAEGWRLRFDWAPRDPDLGRIASLMAPAIVGMAAVQINLFVSSYFASFDEGAVSWLDYAFRILYLPIGVFGVSVGTVATTGLAKQAAARDMPALAATVQRSLRSLAFLTVPSTVGLAVLAVPIVRLLYEHGRFKPSATPPTAAALAIYALGLVAYSSIKVLAPAFYALGRPRIPLLASASAVVANIGTTVLLHPILGYRGIAAGLVVATFVNVLVLSVTLKRTVGPVLGPGAVSFVVRMGTAAALMGAVVHLLAEALVQRLGTHGLTAQAITALVPCAVGGALYMGVALALRVPEAMGLAAILRRRRAR